MEYQIYYCTMGLLGGEKKQEGAERIFEKIIAESIPNLMTNINLRIIGSSMNSKQEIQEVETLIHHKLLLAKGKEKS